MTINWHLHGASQAYIEWFEVPQALRGRGLGTRAYVAWERSLPAKVKTIRLHAADAGDGASDQFWERLGFAYRWTQDDLDGAVAAGADGAELAQEMVKTRRASRARGR